MGMNLDSIYVGDALDVLKTFPDGCVDCVVTSPPYFGLRNYGVAGQLGLEETPEEYVAKMVEIFREVKRVLKEDGTLWLNLGDSYAGSGRGLDGDGTWNPGSGGSKQETHRNNQQQMVGRKVSDESFSKRAMYSGVIGNAWVKPPPGLKQKDLVGIPWRVAFALQADGWWLRQDIIWHKPNPMPESVTDRCTKSHEYLFLLSKSKRYHMDMDAISEEATTPIDTKASQSFKAPGGKACENYGTNEDNWEPNGKRNKRSVWTITTRPYKGAHFATFPEKLVEPCVMAGCRTDGVVLDPFSGSGTTLAVARRLGRRYVGIELNPEYVKLANERLAQQKLI